MTTFITYSGLLWNVVLLELNLIKSAQGNELKKKRLFFF
jgi:hypothetical protein